MSVINLSTYTCFYLRGNLSDVSWQRCKYVLQQHVSALAPNTPLALATSALHLVLKPQTIHKRKVNSSFERQYFRGKQGIKSHHRLINYACIVKFHLYVKKSKYKLYTTFGSNKAIMVGRPLNWAENNTVFVFNVEALTGIVKEKENIKIAEIKNESDVS